MTPINTICYYNIKAKKEEANTNKNYDPYYRRLYNNSIKLEFTLNENENISAYNPIKNTKISVIYEERLKSMNITSEAISKYSLYFDGDGVDLIYTINKSEVSSFSIISQNSSSSESINIGLIIVIVIFSIGWWYSTILYITWSLAIWDKIEDERIRRWWVLFFCSCWYQFIYVEKWAWLWAWLWGWLFKNYDYENYGDNENNEVRFQIRDQDISQVINENRRQTENQERSQARGQARGQARNHDSNQARNQVWDYNKFNKSSSKIEESKEENKFIRKSIFSPSYNNLTNLNRMPYHESQNVIEELCKTEVYLRKESENCAFCLEPMNIETQRLKFLECAHKFHSDCFREYKRVKARNNKVKCVLWRREARV